MFKGGEEKIELIIEYIGGGRYGLSAIRVTRPGFSLRAAPRRVSALNTPGPFGLFALAQYARSTAPQARTRTGTKSRKTRRRLILARTCFHATKKIADEKRRQKRKKQAEQLAL